MTGMVELYHCGSRSWLVELMIGQAAVLPLLSLAVTTWAEPLNPPCSLHQTKAVAVKRSALTLQLRLIFLMKKDFCISSYRPFT
ncbi:hypothetical protein V8C44DRAFT_222499 [Trichoderma aethiopicum]